MSLKTDSRKVREGDTFIAIRNVNTDGHDFIESAINNGAKRIICEEGEYSVETIIVPNTRDYLNNYLYENYYPKIKDMKLIGVTGTNGKTTICYLIYQILTLLGKKCAYIGTIGFYYGNVKKELNNTTPDVDLLYEMLLEAKENNCEYVVMEVSSHALDKNRIYGLKYDEVAFTNLTQDHLDYHKTIENYIEAKKILFKKTRGDKIAVINGDDIYFKEFIMPSNNNIIISKNAGDLKINNVILSHQDTKINFNYKNSDHEVIIKMVGNYNVYNYLTALLLVNKLGFNINDLIKITPNLNTPAGRMEKIEFNSNSIFIDYAHTPDAVINVLNSANEYKKGKIITIIGCGGDRDRTKRPIMGRIAEENSDYVIFTNDNPRFEDEKQIMNDIIEGLSKNNHEVVYDREKAIIKGMGMLKDNDILMLLGKGHETYQIVGNEKIHFSDKEVVQNYIKGMIKK